MPIYKRQTGSTSSTTQWYKFITEENISSYLSNATDARIVKKELSTGQKWSFQFTRGTFICLIIVVPYWNYGRMVVLADGTYNDDGGYVTIGQELNNQSFCWTSIKNGYGACEIKYKEEIYTNDICHIMMIKDSNWWRDNGISSY